jgi:hypothetical protein
MRETWKKASQALRAFQTRWQSCPTMSRTARDSEGLTPCPQRVPPNHAHHRGICQAACRDDLLTEKASIAGRTSLCHTMPPPEHTPLSPQPG